MSGIIIPDLDRKAILITGASTGIGAALARAFAAQGALVGLHYNSSEDAARAVAADIEAAGGSAFLVAGDVARPEKAKAVVEQAAAHFGRLDGLINNAGSMVKRTAIENSDAAHEQLVTDLNAHSVVWCSRAALPFLRRQGGMIINTTSIAARHGGGGGSVLYAASKAYVSSFTRGFAKEVVGDRIRVNAVSPGVIRTPFHDRFSSAEQMRTMEAAIPMGRAGTSEECVGTYLYLASDALSGYVTGQVIEVNGGQLML